MARTFSVTVDTRRSTAYGLFPPGEPLTIIHADPIETPAEGGGVNVSIGFPVLAVAGWVKDPAKFAAKVAELLTQAGM